MRTRPAARFRLVLALWSCVLAAPGLALGEATNPDGRWIPAISIQSGVVGLNVQAGVDSTERGNFEGEGRPVFPFVGTGLELSSPAVANLPGAPRLFVRGGADFIFDLERSVARDGDPGAVNIFFVDPDGPDGPTPPIFPPANRVSGTGSETTTQAGKVAFYAGAGVSFTVPFAGRPIRIRPSIEYRYDELNIGAALSDAVSIAGDDVCPCRTLQISAQDSRGFHAVGPGFELEMDAGRSGPFMAAISMSFQGLYLLGERSATLRADGNFDTGEPASVVSTIKRSPWTFRGGIAVRLRWLPE